MPERRVKLFRSGRYQAVRIPREFELPGEDVIMRKEGDTLTIEPALPRSILAMLSTLGSLDEDFPPIADSPAQFLAMAKASSLSGVRKWLQREEWAEPFDQLLEMHLEVPCDAAGIEMAELPDVLGGDVASNVFGCVFEDMLARELGDGSNIVDDYSKRRGWKEPVPNKRYMTALLSSVMSLYEVSEIVPERSFLARDVLRGGEPVLVSEKLATRGMKPWDLVGLRIVKVGPRTEMTGAALPMRREIGEILRENFVQLREKMREEILDRQKPGDAELEPYALDTEVLRHVASVFTNTWLEDIFRGVLDPTPVALVNADGDTLEPTTVRYPLNPEADRKALADGLAAIPELHPTLDNRWDWLGPGGTLVPGSQAERADAPGNLLPEGSVSRGHVELEDDTLTLERSSPQRAERARALLDPCHRPVRRRTRRDDRDGR